MVFKPFGHGSVEVVEVASFRWEKGAAAAAAHIGAKEVMKV